MFEYVVTTHDFDAKSIVIAAAAPSVSDSAVSIASPIDTDTPCSALLSSAGSGGRLVRSICAAAIAAPPDSAAHAAVIIISRPMSSHPLWIMSVSGSSLC